MKKGWAYSPVLLSSLMLLLALSFVHADTPTTSVLTPLLAPAITDNNPEIAALVKKAEKMTKKLETDVAEKIASLKEEASEKITSINKKAEHKTKKIKHEAELRAQALQENTKAEIKKVHDQIEHHTLALQHDIAKKVTSLVNEAEEKALAARQRAREKAFADRLSTIARVKDPATSADPLLTTPAIINEEWRTKVFEQFNTDTALVKQIIIEGETPDQISDFITHFNKQTLWLDQTLRDTRVPNDASYKKLMDKRGALNKIVDAQKKADALLQDITRKTMLADNHYKKIRLMALYDLNVLAQKKHTHLLSDDEINQVVLALAYEAVPEKIKQLYPTFVPSSKTAGVAITAPYASTGTPQDDAQIKKLKDELEQKLKEKTTIESRLKQTEQEKAALEQQKATALKEASQKFEHRFKDQLEQNMQLKQTNESLQKSSANVLAQKEIEFNEKTASLKKSFDQKLEEKERQFLDLTLQWTSVNQRLDFLGHQVKNAQTMAQLAQTEAQNAQAQTDLMKKMNAQSVNRVSLGDELTDLRIKEIIDKTRPSQGPTTHTSGPQPTPGAPEATRTPTPLAKETQERHNRLQLEEEITTRIQTTQKSLALTALSSDK